MKTKLLVGLALVSLALFGVGCGSLTVENQSTADMTRNYGMVYAPGMTMNATNGQAVGIVETHKETTHKVNAGGLSLLKKLCLFGPEVAGESISKILTINVNADVVTDSPPFVAQDNVQTIQMSQAEVTAKWARENNMDLYTDPNGKVIYFPHHANEHVEWQPDANGVKQPGYVPD
ncbi:MAG: hypothetical protein V4524_01530 [Patescibacteria group bacterium]